jgi:murein DD-endopeptidase MepM/ murein hydrolase activator NlpD
MTQSKLKSPALLINFVLKQKIKGKLQQKGNFKMQKPLEFMKIRQESPNHTFGMVRNLGTKPHQGWDLYAPVGTPTFAIADGLVEYIRFDDGDYGTQLCISFVDPMGVSGDGLLYAFYAHLSQVYVTNKSTVSEGDLIALTGKSGNAINFKGEDLHLHFEIRTAASLGRGLVGRLDPARVLGYEVFTCQLEPICFL